MRRRNARSPLGSSIAGERRTKKLEPPRDSATLSFPGPFECRSPRELAEGGPGESRWVLIGPAPQVPPPRRWGRARRRGDAHGILLYSFYCGNSEMATGFSAAAPSRDPGSISQVLGSRGKKKKKKTTPLLSLHSTRRKMFLSLAVGSGINVETHLNPTGKEASHSYSPKALYYTKL